MQPASGGCASCPSGLCQDHPGCSLLSTCLLTRVQLLPPCAADGGGRSELGAAMYQTNVLGTKGPRKMTVRQLQMSGTMQ